MDIPAILQHLHPDAQWSLSGDQYDGLVWYDDTPMPSEDDLVAAWPGVRDARAWAAVRVERDRLLDVSDWSQMPDNALAAAAIAAWAVYRQALRDVPQSSATPDAVVWPEVP